MVVNDLMHYRKICSPHFFFQAEIMNKAIWGDMGEDSAMITITPGEKQNWHLHFIRTQSGEPSPFDDFVCQVIDEYEKDLDDDALFDLLALHALLIDFERAMKEYQEAEKRLFTH